MKRERITYQGLDMSRRGHSLALANENKVRTGPQRCRNTSPRPRRKNDVVVVGRLKTLDHRRQRLWFDLREISEKAVNVRLAAVTLGYERDVRVATGEVPTQGSRQRDRVFV